VRCNPFRKAQARVKKGRFESEKKVLLDRKNIEKKLGTPWGFVLIGVSFLGL
jgi:hypothetical protein